MCGLIALTGPVPLDVTAAAHRAAAARGPHSSGLAGIREDMTAWRVNRYRGRLLPLMSPGPGVTLVAHSRLATSTLNAGDLPDPDEGQPLTAGPLLIAHNGTLEPELAAGYVPDSLALLEALTHGGHPGDLLKLSEAPQALLWAAEGTLWAYRADGQRAPAHPLYVAAGPDWHAVSSGLLPGGTLLPTEDTHELWRLP